MGIIFKKVEEAKVRDFAELYHGFYSELREKQGCKFQDFDESLKEAQNYIKRGDIVILAMLNDKPIGYARVSERDQVYWIEDIYVKPEYRGKGVGRKLVKEIEKEVSMLDNSVYLMVLPQDRDAFRFWVKMGYTLLNSIELAKEFKPTERTTKTWTIEVLGYPVKIAKWEKEMYSKMEIDLLETLDKFYRMGGDQETFIKLVIEAINKWLSR